MARRRARATLGGLGVVFAFGCDPGPFADFEKDTPVVLFNRNRDMTDGFGVSVAAVTAEDETRVHVGGTAGRSPAAVYGFARDGESVGRDPLNTAGCKSESRDSACGLADQVAGLGRARTGGDPKTLCFALGIGRSLTRPGVDGLVVRCGDNTEYTLTVPESAIERILSDRDVNEEHQPLYLATDQAESPALLAGSPNQGLAWFYGPESTQPVVLEAPDDSETGNADPAYGDAVAVARLGIEEEGSPRLLAVAASESNHVWLFRSDDGRRAERVGCLGGPESFGRALATGDVDGDGVDDLVVSDANSVHVLSGAALARLPRATSSECSLTALPGVPGDPPQSGLIASFTCGSRIAIAGCDESEFGAALAVGDLDDDGDGEVIVGAPAMNVRDEPRAGALLIYDVDPDDPSALTDILFISSAEKDDRLGSSLAVAKLPDNESQHVIVAGASGGSKAGVFYCSTLLDEADRGVRCQ